MSKKIKILTIAGILYSILVIIGVFSGSLSFGQGLGDLLMLFILIGTNFITLLFFFLSKKYNQASLIFGLINTLIILGMIIYFSLSLTVWRGLEAPWDGSILVE